MIFRISLFFILISYGTVVAQTSKSPKLYKSNDFDKRSKGIFYPGELNLATGEVVKSKFRFEYGSGLVYQKVKENTIPYSPNSVISLILNIENSKRVYYSLPYTNERNKTDYLFFEILYEKNDLAVLSNYYVHFKGQSLQSDARGNYINKKVVNNDQRIFLVESNNGLIHFLESIDVLHPGSRKIGNEMKYKYKVVNDTLPEAFFGPNYIEVEKFRKVNSLKYKNLEELIKIMEYFSEIK